MECKKMIEKIETTLSIIKEKFKKNDIRKVDIQREIYNLAEYMTKNEMLGYGLERLDNLLEIFEEKKYSDYYEIVEECFSADFINGTLTFWTKQAERELFANYSLEEIIEMSSMYDNKLNTEKLHIIFAEEELIKEFQNEINNIDNSNLLDDEINLLAIYNILDKNKYTLNKKSLNNFNYLLKKEEGLV